MPGKKCAVLNCNQLQTPLHPFPRETLNPARFKIWLEACGDPSLYSINRDKLHQQYYICHRHFEEKFIARSDRLIKISIPTINLPICTNNEISSKKNDELEVKTQENAPVEFDSLIPSEKESFLGALIHNILDEETPVKANEDINNENIEGTYLLHIPDAVLVELPSDDPIEAEPRSEELPPELLDPEINEINYAQVTIQDGLFSDVCSDKNCSQLSQPRDQLQRVAPNKQKNIVKVFGNNKEFKKPSVIRSLLGKARLSRKGNVYILPIKGKIDSHKLSNKAIERIVRENTSGLSRKQLLKIIRAGRIPRKAPQRKKKCTCSIHCCQQNRLHETLVRSSISSRLDGKFFTDASHEQLINPSNLKTAFSISTILTNVNDKSQVEQLCQLVIESIFRLKNMNTERTLGMLTVYFAESTGNNSSNIREDLVSNPINVCATESINYSEICGEKNIGNQINCSNSSCNNQTIEIIDEVGNKNTNINDSNLKSIEPLEVPEINTPSFSSDERDNSISGEKKHFKVNLGAFHDHSYLALESKILFEKPEYLVNLININTYWAYKRKSRIIKPPTQFKHLPAKHQKQFSKLNKKIMGLQGMLERKIDKIKLCESKIKYLRNIIQDEKGIKRLKYPKDINLNQLAAARDDNLVKKNSCHLDKRNKGKSSPEFDMFPFIEENRESLDDLNPDLLLQDSIYERFNEFFESANIDF